MIQSKKAIGFFFSLAFLAFLSFYFSARGLLPFTDFALIEWQMKLAGQTIFYLPYLHQIQDPSFSFFPLPDLFFQLTNGKAHSTFPNFYPFLFSPLLKFFGTVSITVAQLILFFGAIYIFHQIKKDVVSTVLLLFGSSLPIYIFLIHETILIFFLEILVLFLFSRNRVTIAGILSALMIWIRPEMSMVMVLVPFCFSNHSRILRFGISILFVLSIFVLGNLYTTGSFFPLRMAKNSDFQFRLETIFYLTKIWIGQVPIFLLSCFFFLRSSVSKQISFPLILLLLVTVVTISLAPNTGGHNTPRYLYGFVPLYILILRKDSEMIPVLSYRWMFALTLISLYTIWNLNGQMKELKKISKFQANTLNEIRKLDDSMLLFNNSDFSFVALPLLQENKDLLLLRKDYDQQDLAELLQKENIKSFTFLELPPSPFTLPENLIIPNCPHKCSFRKTKTLSLPNTLLPITQTQYLRK
ncbi:LA_3751/LA_3752 family putative glycosyltransferase [Leptospira vanthielii]|uniref:Glycosyltransferase RgtA/B/C/D-like domain-containing protein n=1 Tax=Leptospira vanthielii TaxID=293085 RepID=A0ABY2NT16_9LEPT|nr:hypothetical protein [Leptospira vanthielii]TGM60377.1 hypothetical protein EHQ95_03210 [Leptospira vanthielii]